MNGRPGRPRGGEGDLTSTVGRWGGGPRTWVGVALVAAALAPAARTSVPAAPSKLSGALEVALQRSGERTHAVWVHFTDRGTAPRSAVLSPEALARRARRGAVKGAVEADRPLDPGYVRAVAGSVTRLRHQVRWSNAVSVEATPAQVEALSRLRFVARLDVVRRYRQRPEVVEPLAERPLRGASAPSAGPAHLIDYGTSLGQLQQISVPAVHDLGLHGQGVTVAVLDSGFDNLAHEAFATTTILATRDFVNGDDDVGDGADQGDGSHGTSTLSTIGGFAPGQLVGPAFAARYILAKTENTVSETPVEEDHWAAAAEWAEALGADVISSSLGYLDYDRPYTSYTWMDMDGATAISTRAATLAAERGVVVVNSAGNSGFALRNTLGAPADGIFVLTAGAVDAAGVRASFSSVGPTADLRIKPDVVAQGVAVKVARSTATNAYGLANGTSFSCPLSAGVVALLLQAHPEYTVEDVLAVVRATASRSATPDNLTGWGTLNALAAVSTTRPAP